MKSKKRSPFFSDSMILVYVILLFSAVVAVREPAFLSPGTAINLLRAMILILSFALCEMVVMIGGGIDISFPAIGCVSMYVPTFLYNNGLIPDSGLVFFLIAILCGLLFGMLNGFLVSMLRVPSLIATLATSSIASGGLAFIFGVRDYSNIPSSLLAVYRVNLATYIDPATGMNYQLPVLLFFPVVMCLLMSFVLRRTMIGRGIYAMGGNYAAAGTVGFNVKALQFFSYVFSGVFTAITAVIYLILMQNASTTALMGDEMLVIAACVVGGCSLKGGKGSVIGVILGTTLISLVKNHLNMLGIETAWQTFAVGLVILFGFALTTLSERKAGRDRK